MGGIKSANGGPEKESPLFIRLVTILCILFFGHGPVLAQFAGNRYEVFSPECQNILKHQCAPCSQNTECLKGSKCCKVSGVGGCCSPLTSALAENLPHHPVFSISRCPAGIHVKRPECISCDKHHECPKGFGCCEVTNIGGCCLPLQTLKRARAAERRRQAQQDRPGRKRKMFQRVCRSELLGNQVKRNAESIKTRKTILQRSAQPTKDISIKSSKRQTGHSEKTTLGRSDQPTNDTSSKPNKRQAGRGSLFSKYDDDSQKGYYSDNKKLGNRFQLGYGEDRNDDSGYSGQFGQVGNGLQGLLAGENSHCPVDIRKESWDCFSCNDNTQCLNGFRCCPLPGKGGCCIDTDKIVRGKMTVSSAQDIPNQFPIDASNFPIDALRSVYGNNEFSMEISTEEYELPGVLSDGYYEEKTGNSVCSSVGVITRSTCFSCSDYTECIRGYECCDIPSIGGCCVSN